MPVYDANSHSKENVLYNQCNDIDLPPSANLIMHVLYHYMMQWSIYKQMQQTILEASHATSGNLLEICTPNKGYCDI